MSNTASPWTFGMAHFGTAILMIGGAALLPVIGNLAAREAAPADPVLVGIVTCISAVAGLVLAWRGGYWVSGHAGAGADARVATLLGGASIAWTMAKKEEGGAVLVATLLFFSLPTVACLLGIQRHRQQARRPTMSTTRSEGRPSRQPFASRLRFLIVWGVFLAMYIGLISVLMLIRPLGLPLPQALGLILVYVFASAFVFWWIGRFLHRHWQKRPLHATTVLIPALAVILWPLMMTNAAASTIAFAMFEMVVPSAAFLVGFGLIRRRA
jgi:hypothetical protein